MKKLLFIASSACLLMACGQSAKDAQMQATLDSMNQVAAQQHIIDSVNAQKRIYEERNTQVESNGNVTQTTTVHKKKWSAKAKGAVIGAGVGAVAGALIDKNHLAGAAIGGASGAAVGLGAGAVIDSKKKKKEEQQQSSGQ